MYAVGKREAGLERERMGTIEYQEATRLACSPIQDSVREIEYYYRSQRCDCFLSMIHADREQSSESKENALTEDLWMKTKT